MLMAHTKTLLQNNFASSISENTVVDALGNSCTIRDRILNVTTGYPVSASALFKEVSANYGLFGLAPGANTAEPDADNPVVPEDDRTWCGLVCTAGHTDTYLEFGGLLITQTYTNATEADITVNCVYFIWRNYTNGYPCLLAHDKFENPVVLAPGESITFQYSISIT